jgi:hypothetical protein
MCADDYCHLSSYLSHLIACLDVSGPAAILCCPCVPCLFSLPHFYVSLPVPIVYRPAAVLTAV